MNDNYAVVDRVREAAATDRDTRVLANLTQITMAARLFASIVQRADEIDHPYGFAARQHALDFLGSYIEDCEDTERKIRDRLSLEGV